MRKRESKTRRARRRASWPCWASSEPSSTCSSSSSSTSTPRCRRQRSGMGGACEGEVRPSALWPNWIRGGWGIAWRSLCFWLVHKCVESNLRDRQLLPKRLRLGRLRDREDADNTSRKCFLLLPKKLRLWDLFWEKKNQNKTLCKICSADLFNTDASRPDNDGCFLYCISLCLLFPGHKVETASSWNWETVACFYSICYKEMSCAACRSTCPSCNRQQGAANPARIARGDAITATVFSG